MKPSEKFKQWERSVPPEVYATQFYREQKLIELMDELHARIERAERVTKDAQSASDHRNFEHLRGR